jgi:K+-sensing histidine kinase KdpD
MSNAVAVANRKAGPLKSVTIQISTEASMVIMRLADDGPGLPASIRARSFGTRSRRSAASRHGYGLAIAREVAERNGGTLTLVPAAKGTTFALKLPAFVSVLRDRPQVGRGPWPCDSNRGAARKLWPLCVPKTQTRTLCVPKTSSG